MIDTSDPEDEDPTFKEVCKHLGKITSKVTLVDYGCGDGNFGFHGLMKHCKDLNHIQYVGVELDEKKLDSAKDYSEQYGFYNGDWPKPQFITVEEYFKHDNESIDLIVCCKTLHDIDSIHLHEVFYHNLRILKPEGVFIFYDKVAVKENEETDAVAWTHDDFEKLLEGTSIDVRAYPSFNNKKNREELIAVLVKSNDNEPDFILLKNRCIEIIRDKENDLENSLSDYDNTLNDYANIEKERPLSLQEEVQRNLCKLRHSAAVRQRDKLTKESSNIRNHKFKRKLIDLKDVKHLLDPTVYMDVQRTIIFSEFLEEGR